MKTRMSRFTVHDDLSAPEASLPILKGARASAGQLPNFLGVLAGSPAAASCPCSKAPPRPSATASSTSTR